jgi:hypothetical protein
LGSPFFIARWKEKPVIEVNVDDLMHVQL